MGQVKSLSKGEKRTYTYSGEKKQEQVVLKSTYIEGACRSSTQTHGRWLQAEWQVVQVYRQCC